MSTEVTETATQDAPNEATGAPQEPAKPAPGTDTQGGADKPAGAQQEAENKAPSISADEFEAMKKELTKFQKAEQERIEAAKTAEEKAADAAKKAADNLAKLQRENAALRIRADYGFGDDEMEHLSGDTYDELKKSAEYFKPFFDDAKAFRDAMKAEEGKAEKKAPRTMPRAELKPGATPQEVVAPPTGDRGYPASWIPARLRNK